MGSELAVCTAFDLIMIIKQSNEASPFHPVRTVEYQLHWLDAWFRVDK